VVLHHGLPAVEGLAVVDGNDGRLVYDGPLELEDEVFATRRIKGGVLLF